ncbi:prefoldin subunit 1 [Schizosaccharomyces japonicus yFS275]|uniref:Prefoldin subunit 1 n=1 Tax=Schizosaccharomyces japonicus (strain yFS275 / FY16936) TaxID=402676 RepID=B6K4A9_SCHJY|nr:prefoldin subunit 1 [Schizosaccharomyces japonicus yFS275]EEB08316.1 prefoldin subunit 1 [Schizosaccharomyces japonicus yFS275]
MDKLLKEIQDKALDAQQQYRSVSMMIASKERQNKMNQLTLRELSDIQKDAAVYSGVGKINVDTVKSSIDKDVKSNNEDVEALKKKLNYYETTLKNATEHIVRVQQANNAGN